MVPSVRKAQRVEPRRSGGNGASLDLFTSAALMRSCTECCIQINEQPAIELRV
jgi:hypothetical protein